jgi:8-oxo-dGTP diphosphatase
VSQAALHSVSVSAIITNDAGYVLLVQRRDNRRWEPPGGILELNESITEGLKREVREETGLEVEPERLTGVYKNLPHAIVALVFRANVIRGHLTTGVETTHLAWVTPASVGNRCDEAFAVRLLDALNDSGVVVRVHDGEHLTGESVHV